MDRPSRGHRRPRAAFQFEFRPKTRCSRIRSYVLAVLGNDDFSDSVIFPPTYSVHYEYRVFFFTEFEALACDRGEEISEKKIILFVYPIRDIGKKVIANKDKRF